MPSYINPRTYVKVVARIAHTCKRCRREIAQSEECYKNHGSHFLHVDCYYAEVEKLDSQHCRVKIACNYRGDRALYWYWTPGGVPDFQPIEIVIRRPDKSAVFCCQRCRVQIERNYWNLLNTAHLDEVEL